MMSGAKTKSMKTKSNVKYFMISKVMLLGLVSYSFRILMQNDQNE